MNRILEILVKYDNHVLSGFKTFLTIVVLFSTIYFMPDQKVTPFIGALGLTHLFGLAVAKRRKGEK